MLYARAHTRPNPCPHARHTRARASRGLPLPPLPPQVVIGQLSQAQTALVCKAIEGMMDEFDGGLIPIEELQVGCLAADCRCCMRAWGAAAVERA